MKKSVSFVPCGRPTRFVRTQLSQVVPARAAPTTMKLGKRGEIDSSTTTCTSATTEWTSGNRYRAVKSASAPDLDAQVWRRIGWRRVSDRYDFVLRFRTHA